MEVRTSTRCIRVYLVEDEALLRETLVATLELEDDIEVVGQAADAEQALRALETTDVDVVLMDVRLPGANGIEATRILKEKRKDLVVIMLTAYDDQYVGVAIDAGASGYILKSCTLEQLVESIRIAHSGDLIIDPALTGRLARELSELRKVHKDLLMTPRQLEVLNLVSLGSHYHEISQTLYISERTVHREMGTIFLRLGAKDAAHAVSKAHKLGLI